MPKTITILGLNGRIGQEAARAFVAAGWQVTGFARTDRVNVPGVTFIAGNAENTAEVAAACAGSEVVLDAVNLPYDKWDKGRYERSLETRLAALRGTGKTLLYPGNIYNYAAETHLLTPDTPQHPEKDKGEIRVRLEQMLAQAATNSELQVLILRAPDFYGPGATGTVLDLIMLRDIAKGVVHYPNDPAIGHSWAYLPDLARAFFRIAEARTELPTFEALHFAGHFKTGHETFAALQAAAPQPLRLNRYRWRLITLLSPFVPLLREVLKMNYLWTQPHRLSDPKLEALLGPDFLTPFDKAMGTALRSYLPSPAQSTASRAISAQG